MSEPQVLRITGEVANPLELSYEDLASLPAEHQVADVSRLDPKRQGSAGSPARAQRSHAPRRLEDFVVGASNRLAHAAACRLAEDADPRLLSPLFIHGPCGVGKTHLLLGVCQRFGENWPEARVRYVPAEQFTNEYITAVRNDKIDEFRRRVRRLDLLAIDDVHFLSSKMRTQTEFLHTLDESSRAQLRWSVDSNYRDELLAYHAVTEELAVSLQDVLLRRTGIGQSRCRGLDCAAGIGARMAALGGWSSRRLDAELDAYHQSVERGVRFRAR